MSAVAPAAPSSSRAALLAEIQRLRETLAAQAAFQEADDALLREVELSRDRYADLYDFAPVGYLTLDARGCVREANLTGAKMLGVERQALVGLHLLNLVDHADRRAWLRHLSAFRRGESEQATVEVRVRPRARATQVLRFHTTIHKGAAGAAQPNVSSLRSALLDVTAQRLAEEALLQTEQRYRLVGEMIPFGAWEADRRGIATYFSRSFLDMTDKPLEELRRLWLDLEPAADGLPTLAAWERCAAAGELWERELRVEGRDGCSHAVLARGLPTRDRAGEIAGFVGMNFDITARRQAEDERRRAFGELERSNRDLEAFAYVASHDLREPLRMVSAYTGLLRERYEGRLDARADHYMSSAVEGARRMQALIGDLLAYARAGAAPPPAVPVRVRRALELALAELREAVADSGARVTWGRLPTVAADERQLVLVFQNLLENAIKYRRPRRAPAIRVEARRVADPVPAWRFSVRDDGIGIEGRFAEKIFEIFQRLDARERHPGTGIGLAICRRVVERLGGRIWVESSLGRGATFFFTVPLTPVPPACAPAAAGGGQ